LTVLGLLLILTRGMELHRAGVMSRFCHPGVCRPVLL